MIESTYVSIWLNFHRIGIDIIEFAWYRYRYHCNSMLMMYWISCSHDDTSTMKSWRFCSRTKVNSSKTNICRKTSMILFLHYARTTGSSYEISLLRHHMLNCKQLSFLIILPYHWSPFLWHDPWSARVIKKRLHDIFTMFVFALI